MIDLSHIRQTVWQDLVLIKSFAFNEVPYLRVIKYTYRNFRLALL